MKLTWLGHSSFRLEIADQVLLIDPWIAKNPVFPADRRQDAVHDATAIFLSHGHVDHADDAVGVARETGAPIFGIPELMQVLAARDGGDGVTMTGFNKGGTITLGGVKVTMVNATHSSAVTTDAGPVYAGDPAGFMIAGEDRTVYFSGDTDIMADMDWMGKLHKPEIGILCAGGHYTMDMERAAYAAKTYFDFKTIVPCHYRTFDALEQSARALAEALPGVNVKEPEVMETMEL